jgi:HD-GYP domain-containing protein (c-di-GMP phosphodiesterase class II)
VSSELAWENEIFFNLSQKMSPLINFLEDSRIERIVFQQGLGFEELRQFITFLTLSKKGEKVDEQEYFSLNGIQNIRAGRLRSLGKAEGTVEAADRLQMKYKNSLQAVTHSLNVVLDEEEIDYLDLRFNILSIMEDFFGRHQELLNLVSVKQKDLTTFVHLLNVALLSMFFGSKLRLAKDDVLDLGIAALYHDIGKLHISKKILKKKSKLDEQEFVKIKDHPMLGAKILEGYKDYLGILAPVVAFEHHLRYDLGGYPRVAYPRKPHLASLLVSICDVYDALALRRSYKKDYPPDKIYEVMSLEKGKIFDPQLLDKFFQFIGVWPVGTLVLLSDQRVAVVREVHERDAFRPTVEIIAPESQGEMVNLDQQGDLTITQALNPRGAGKKYLSSISSPLAAA